MGDFIRNPKIGQQTGVTVAHALAIADLVRNIRCLMSYELDPSTERPARVGVRRPLLGETVLNRLLGLIASGEVKPGDRLPSEPALAEQLGVSRVTLRESVKMLSVMGLVDVRHGRGTFVRQPESSPLTRPISVMLGLYAVPVFELLEVRRVIEFHTVQEAARRRSDSGLARLREHVGEMERVLDSPERYIELDKAFHLEIARCADNRVLAALLEMIRDRLREDLLKTVRKRGKTERYERDHGEILRAVECRDGELAQSIMAQHLGKLEQEFIQAEKR